uniref:DDE Tnp4 domain-containing protein n=1 Tax=Magallana gigas TaxID=29159 RepID=A0A8W8L739_MAGGI
MEDHIDGVERLERIDQLFVRRPRPIRDRLDPFLFYDEEDFLVKFRFCKRDTLLIMDMLGNDLEPNQRDLMSVSPLNHLLITLRFFATGAFQQVKRGFMDIGRIPEVVGAIDCTHIPIQSPRGRNTEIYRNRKGFFSINVQAICDHECNFTNIVARCPGSTHESRIFENSNICARFERHEIDGILLGDNGYPLRQYLITRPEIVFNNAHCHSRVKIENAFGILKRMFPCLRIKLSLKRQTVLHVIVSCAILYNMRRKWNGRLPFNDDADINDPIVPVPVPQRPNQRGQTIRLLLIRHFQ